MTVLVLGVPSEPPVAAVVGAVRHCRGDVAMWNQRDTLETDVELHLAATEPGEHSAVEGRLTAPGLDVDLASLSGIYVRLCDNEELPELSGLEPDHPSRQHADRVLDAMFTLCQVSPAVVVNRPGAPDENASKPRQLQLISEFFHTPSTLVTDDPDEVARFWDQHGRVVYKSVSGERSIVTELTQADLPRLDAVGRCPVQFQEYVDGIDVRVHSLSSGEVFGMAAWADTVDYRYGTESTMTRIEVPVDVALACLDLTAHLGLELAGIDFKVTDDDRWVCLEANPSPAFTAFDDGEPGVIAAALARLLTGGDCGCGC